VPTLIVGNWYTLWQKVLAFQISQHETFV